MGFRAGGWGCMADFSIYFCSWYERAGVMLHGGKGRSRAGVELFRSRSSRYRRVSRRMVKTVDGRTEGVSNITFIHPAVDFILTEAQFNLILKPKPCGIWLLPLSFHYFINNFFLNVGLRHSSQTEQWNRARKKNNNWKESSSVFYREDKTTYREVIVLISEYTLMKKTLCCLFFLGGKGGGGWWKWSQCSRFKKRLDEN